MGACIARCLPLYSDPRYQPVRSRYLIQDDVVQAEPTRASRISVSSDESLCMSDLLDPSEPTDEPLPDDEPPILLLTPGLAQSPVIFTPVDPPPAIGSPPATARLVTVDVDASLPLTQSVASSSTQQQRAEDEVELTQRVEQPPPDSSPLRPTPLHTPARISYGGASGPGVAERWWGSALPGSLPSLAEVDSPPTASLDLEWEPEAGNGRESRESLGTGEEEASQTAESNSWVPRSACSTPNSLEWDFRASTLSLRGQGEEEPWQTSDQETEQLLYEIEQLAARALADTGHGLQPNR